MIIEKGFRCDCDAYLTINEKKGLIFYSPSTVTPLISVDKICNGLCPFKI